MEPSLAKILLPLDPNPDELLRALCQASDERVLSYISKADCSGDKESLAALRPIVQTATVPCPMAGDPREVCSLVCWDPPDTFRPDQLALSEDKQFRHLCRLLSCAILLRAARDNTGCVFGENSKAAVAIASALVLGEPYITLTKRALADLCLYLEDDSERPLLLFGVLLTELATATEGDDGDRLLQLAQAVIQEENKVRQSEWFFGTPDWLTGTSSFQQRDAMWKSFARHLLVNPAKPHPPKADEILRLMGGMMLNW